MGSHRNDVRTPLEVTVGLDPLSWAVIGAGVAAAGGSVYQGEVSKKGQKKSLAAQERAQADTLAAQTAERARADQEMAAANRRKASIQIDEFNKAATAGPAGTMLTGPKGIEKPKLGANTLLGI
jgi:hypothetical protein